MKLVKPYQYVGVDYKGHLWVRDEFSDQSVKVYVLVFTCLDIRAVHFEVFPNMSTEMFVLASHKCINTYSATQFLYCENVKAFLKSGKVIKDSFQTKEVQEELKRKK